MFATWLVCASLGVIGGQQPAQAPELTPELAPLLAPARPPVGALAAQLPANSSTAPAVTEDYSWVSSNYGPAEHPLTAGPFTFELRLDTALHYSAANPQDDTISGSSEVFRHGELQLTHVAFGGNVEHRRVQARLMLQLGLYSQTTPRNDSSPTRGQWQLDNALRYLSEAYVGYHFDALSGVNLQAGLFMSYIGLWSYYNFDNWTYQPSYVSSNTPWFFNGVRLQVNVTERLKIEPWLVNGWQSYGRFNQAPGVGAQVLYRPHDSVNLVSNIYFGADTLGVPRRKRLHSDSSALVRYVNRPGARLSKAAFSVTFDGGFESGGGVRPSDQHFLGVMAYHRLWFAADRLALTVGGGLIKNPGRYLVLLPPINGATAASGSPYFSLAPKDSFFAWDLQGTFDVMPNRHATLRVEYTYRRANAPYFSGRGGVTPPGGNTGTPAVAVPSWAPDLTRHESRATLALMVRL